MRRLWSRLSRKASRFLRPTVAALLFLTFVVPPHSFRPAAETEAADLAWSDVRPPLSDEADTDGSNGFRHLPDFGNALHAVVVAPNGDVFAAGTGADVDANGDGDCADATDADGDSDGICDAAATASPAIFKSSDGGMKWRSARVGGAGAGTTIQQVVVSPDYPLDPFVMVVFSDGQSSNAGTNRNGICWSTDGGLSFASSNCRTGASAAVEPDLDDVLWLTVALSPDFDFADGAGVIALGGRWVSGFATTATATTMSLKAALAATTVNTMAETTASAADGPADVTLHLAYTYDEEPITLARLFVLNGTNTFGQAKASFSWNAMAAGEELRDDNTVSFGADRGMVAFDDLYEAGGVLFAAAGIGGTSTGGVFRWNGAYWDEKTAGDLGCDAPVDAFAVAGNASTTKIVAALSGSSTICRSSNEGSTWSDTQADGGDSVCDLCRIDSFSSTPATRVANNRVSPDTVYYTHSGARGGVIKSTNLGSIWADTGLTNQPYVVVSVEEVSATQAFALATVPATMTGAGLDALFLTNDYGTGAGWQRVLRYDGTDLVLSLPADLATAGVVWAWRFNATTDAVLKSTDGGKTFDSIATDPFENSPESFETPAAGSSRSATTLYLGGNKGHVSYTTNGGTTWTILARDFGEDIDEFDFTTDPNTFFVTAEGLDATNKVWQTRDGGATFTQVGNAPWGTGDGAITTLITGYVPADNSGSIIVVTGSATTTDEVYRMAMGETVWTDLDLDVEWDSALSTTVSSGDGVMLVLWDNDGSIPKPLQMTVFPISGAVLDFDPLQSGPTEGKNPLLALPAPPVFTTGSSLGTAKTLPGYTLQTIATGRVMELTLTPAFLGITTVSPAHDGMVPSNVGASGVPTLFRWSEVPGADGFELAIGQNPQLVDGLVVATPATNQVNVSGMMFPLTDGSVYYWRARVRSAQGAAFEGPWSAIASFRVGAVTATVTVSPTSGLAGGTVSVHGAGFGVTERVQVIWDSPFLLVATPTTDINGDFTTGFAVPAQAPTGAHVVRALGEASNKGAFSSFTVDVPPADAATLRGAVTIGVPGAGAVIPPPGLTLVVTMLTLNTTDEVAKQTVSTDGAGGFSVRLPDLPGGSYDLTVKGQATLSSKKAGVGLPQPAGAAPLNFGTLRSGDLNGDDLILGADYSILVSNFGVVGPTMAPAAFMKGDIGVGSPVVLAVSREPGPVAPGQQFEVRVVADAGTQAVDAVDVFLSFPRGLMELVENGSAGGGAIRAGEALPVILLKEVDAAEGRISFSSGRPMGGTPVAGSFTLATLRFRAHTALPGTAMLVQIEFGGSRMSGAFHRGERLPRG